MEEAHGWWKKTPPADHALSPRETGSRSEGEEVGSAVVVSRTDHIVWRVNEARIFRLLALCLAVPLPPALVSMKPIFPRYYYTHALRSIFSRFELLA